FAHDLAVVPGLGDGEQFTAVLHAAGDRVEDVRPFGHRGLAPGRCRLVPGLDGALDVLGRAGRNLGEALSGDRAGVLDVGSAHARHPPAPDEVLVAGLEGGQRCALTGLRVDSHCNSFDASAVTG